MRKMFTSLKGEPDRHGRRAASAGHHPHRQPVVVVRGFLRDEARNGYGSWCVTAAIGSAGSRAEGCQVKREPSVWSSREDRTSPLRRCLGYHRSRLDTPDIASVAALVADRSRAQMLTALMDGRSLTATELAVEADIAASTASSERRTHLGGALGAAILARLFDLRFGWSETGNRLVILSLRGRAFVETLTR